MSSGGSTQRASPTAWSPTDAWNFIFDLDDPRGAIVVGAMQRAKVVVLRAGARVFGVRFRQEQERCTSIHRLASCAIESCPLDEATRSRRSRLVDRVLDSRSDDNRRAAVGAFLAEPTGRVRASNARLRRAVQVIHASKGARR